MNLTLLRSSYPYLTVRNKTAHSQTVMCDNGDSVQVQPSATVRLATATLNQIPDSRLFTLVSPTLPQLIAAEIVTPESID